MAGTGSAPAMAGGPLGVVLGIVWLFCQLINCWCMCHWLLLCAAAAAVCRRCERSCARA
jgi:hypothetical protein